MERLRDDREDDERSEREHAHVSHVACLRCGGVSQPDTERDPAGDHEDSPEKLGRDETAEQPDRDSGRRKRERSGANREEQPHGRRRLARTTEQAGPPEQRQRERQRREDLQCLVCRDEDQRPGAVRRREREPAGHFRRQILGENPHRGGITRPANFPHVPLLARIRERAGHPRDCAGRRAKFRPELAARVLRVTGDADVDRAPRRLEPGGLGLALPVISAEPRSRRLDVRGQRATCNVLWRARGDERGVEPRFAGRAVEAREFARLRDEPQQSFAAEAEQNREAAGGPDGPEEPALHFFGGRPGYSIHQPSGSV